MRLCGVGLRAIAHISPSKKLALERSGGSISRYSDSTSLRPVGGQRHSAGRTVNGPHREARSGQALAVPVLL